MRRVMFAVTLAICGGITMSGTSLAESPDVGDEAPPFELKGSDGETYQLADFKDKTVVILAWFPKAFTGG